MLNQEFAKKLSDEFKAECTISIGERCPYRPQEEKRKCKGLSNCWETNLFGKLSNLICNLPDNFHIEEYHGNSHQVRFDGEREYNHDWRRKNARCELADLLIVTYRHNPKSIRLSFVQAKRERKIIDVNSTQELVFKANLEQWDLLGNRPVLKEEDEKKRFNPPPKILTGAVLPSVGTFIFFYKTDKTAPYEIFYCIADKLSPNCNPKTRDSYLKVGLSICHLCRENIYEICKMRSDNLAYPQILYAFKAYDFALALSYQLIGTPIEDNPKDTEQKKACRDWLFGVLNQLKKERKELGTQAEGLLTLIGESNDVDKGKFFLSGVKSIIILNTDQFEPYKEPSIFEHINHDYNDAFCKK